MNNETDKPTEEKPMGLFEALRHEWDKWRDVKGREGQRARRQLRRNENALKGQRVRFRKGSAKGDSRGAFGTRPKVDARPALTPEQMRQRGK